MDATRQHTAWFVSGLMLAWLVGHPVLADDTEIFLGSSVGAGSKIRPNILFVIDTSGSMNSNVTTQTPFDPNIVWPGSCDPSRVYWRQDTGSPPGCGTSRWFDRTALRCDAAFQAFGNVGFYTDNIAQWDPRSSRLRWDRIRSGQKSRLVECRVDSGVHGDGFDFSKLWAADRNNGPWSDDPNDEVPWTGNTGRTYTLYDANWLNWFWNATTVTQTRLEIVQQVSKDLLDSIDGVNVGLMRFSDNHRGDPFETRAEGGMIVHAMEDIATGRSAMKTKIDAFIPGGWTPPAESLYEAGLYFMGKPVDYGVNSKGNNQTAEPSVPESRLLANQSLYKSPMEYSCQKNFVVLLTDGEPTTDTTADSKIMGQPSFNTIVAPQCDGLGAHGACLDDLAEYLFEADLDSNLDGAQNVATYTIGFTVDLPILDNTAKRGGGEYYLADDTSSLTIALTNIVTEILQQTTTFVSPTVSINAFNRTQNLNDLFITMFRPEAEVHWPGNLKKYRIEGDRVVGTDGNDVVDMSTGFIRDNALSFWPDPVDPVDGSEVTRGGAANQLPDPNVREVYTYLAGADLTSGSNAVALSNGLITDVMLGGGSPGDPTRDQLINFARGLDEPDSDGDGVINEPRRSMGDPLHSKPVTVIYSGDALNADLSDALIFAATNEGHLHAVDPMTGVELWTFVPPTMLGKTLALYNNDPAANKNYAIDGSIVAYKRDNNENGVVEPADGDGVYLFVGQRRGGDAYIALDVTVKDSPRFMWMHDSATLPGLGQTWSTPVVSNLEVQGVAQNPENEIVVVGGGYDTTQDNPAYSTDVMGNGVYILDAQSGNLLWRAGNDAGADLTLAEMDNAIPAEVRVLDMDVDGFADRMYVGDMGGRIWRFDLFNNTPSSSLGTGGVLARLGSGNVGGGPSDNRRFYNALDLAIVPFKGGGGYLSINVGSGYRAHPLDLAVEDNFFAVRDPNVFKQLSSAEYGALTPIVIGDLDDITGDPAPVLPINSKGWRLELRDPAFVGEKVLSESITFADTVFFTSFLPQSNPNSCLPSAGLNKLYAVNIRNGAPVNNFDDSVDPNNLTVEDRAETLAQGGIAPEPVFLFPDQTNCSGVCPDVLGLVGVESFDPGNFPAFIRKFWLGGEAEL